MTISSLVQIVSVNPENGTLGEHPHFTITDQFLSQDGTLYFTTNITYGGGDLEEDISGSNITGRRRTDFIVKFLDSEVNLTIKVYEDEVNDNINAVILNRTYKGTL